MSTVSIAVSVGLFRRNESIWVKIIFNKKKFSGLISVTFGFAIGEMLLQSLGHLKGLLYDEGVIIDDPVSFFLNLSWPSVAV